MVAIPVEGRWSVRSLGDADAPEVLAFLNRSPIENVYLISRIGEEGLVDRYSIGVLLGGRLVAVALLTSNVVLTADADLTESQRETALDIIADRMLTRVVPVRAMISDQTLVEGLWKRIAAHFDPPTVVRLSQPVYVLDPAVEHPDLREVRYSVLADLDLLVPACAAMHTEEVGINPLARDAFGYRERVRDLVSRRRSFVLMRGRDIAFKTELSAVTPEAVQLMGVWTAPRFRRQGLARIGLAEICGHLRREGRQVTLFVNDFNAPAIALYESLGFRRIGAHRALIW